MSFINFPSTQIQPACLEILSSQLLDRLVLQRINQVNVFILVLFVFNDDLYLSAASQFLMNIFTKNLPVYKSKLQASSAVKRELKSLYNYSSKNDVLAQFFPTKLDLAFLMTTFELMPKIEWLNDPNIVKFIFWFLKYVRLFN